MIDAESMIFDELYNAIISEYPNAKIDSTLNLDPSEFPCVYIEEINNSTNTQTIDSASNENHANIAYEINVYSNKRAGKKAEAKTILSIPDEILISWGFQRISITPLDMDNGTKHRIVARYEAVISKDKIIYRR